MCLVMIAVGSDIICRENNGTAGVEQTYVNKTKRESFKPQHNLSTSMKVPMSKQQILQRIILTSQKLKSSLAPCQFHTDLRRHVHSDAIDIPPLRLDERMATFKANLQISGLLPQISELASLKAKELATHYQQSYERLCKDLLSSPRTQGPPITDVLHHLRNTFESIYDQKDLRNFIASAQKIQGEYLKGKSRSSSSPSLVRRSIFNYVCSFFFLSK